MHSFTEVQYLFNLLTFERVYVHKNQSKADVRGKNNISIHNKREYLHNIGVKKSFLKLYTKCPNYNEKDSN